MRFGVWKRVYRYEGLNNWRFLIQCTFVDLDSIVCAVLVAEALRKLYKIRAFPVLNTFRPETIKMRGEVTCTLGENSNELMITLVDALVKAGSAANVQIFLVDHNELSLQWPSNFAQKATVVGIIDHHFDGGKYKDTCRFGRVIGECGSNTSLVVREVFAHPELAEMDTDFMKVALYPIIFDTKHYRFRATDLDLRSTRVLLNLISEDEEHVRDMTAEFWKSLLDAELDELDLPLADLLYKDYKQYSLNCQSGPYTLGMSTIRSSFEGHMIHSNRSFPQMIEDVIMPFFHTERLDGMLLIFAYQDAISLEFLQEFVMVFPGIKVDRVISFFAIAGMEFSASRGVIESFPATMATSGITGVAEITWVPQRNRFFNRKKIQPLLQEYLLDHF